MKALGYEWYTPWSIFLCFKSAGLESNDHQMLRNAIFVMNHIHTRNVMMNQIWRDKKAKKEVSSVLCWKLNLPYMKYRTVKQEMLSLLKAMKHQQIRNSFRSGL
jgi:hypothetical protein